MRTGPDEPSGLRHEHVDIACDESGFSGGNLVSSHTPVFAHASVRLSRETARALVEDIRQRIGGPDGEIKASRLLRAQHRPVVLSLLGPDSPVQGQARVHLTDTKFFVVARLLDVLLGDAPVAGTDCPGRNAGTRRMALTLYHSGEQGHGRAPWSEFLTAAGNLFRTNNRWLPANPVTAFYTAVHRLRREPAPVGVGEVMRQLEGTRTIAEAVRAAHLADPKLTPLLEPLIPALTRTVQVWGAVSDSVSVVHDEQSALTPERISDIAAAFALGHPERRLVDVQRVDSRTDARVQVADFVAGIARRLASDSLQGGEDRELAGLLRPLVDPQSVWAARGCRSARGLRCTAEHHRPESPAQDGGAGATPQPQLHQIGARPTLAT
jgi:hypothetical protein